MIVVAMATYNEADNIAQLLSGLKDYEVILVDSSSPDGTAAIARKFENVTVIEVPNLGIATAYLQALGIAFTKECKFVIQMDAGLTHDPADIPRLVEACRHKDLVIGARRFLSWSYHSLVRSLVSLTAAWLMRRKGITVSDATSGFRCWRTSKARPLFRMLLKAITSAGFSFQFELLYYVYLAGFSIGEIPIEYRLTNSSFNWGMVWEAIKVYRGLA